MSEAISWLLKFVQDLGGLWEILTSPLLTWNDIAISPISLLSASFLVIALGVMLVKFII